MRHDEETLEDALDEMSDEDRKELVRRQFEESDEWIRHKQFHDEHGGQPILKVWEFEVPAEHIPAQQAAEEPQHHLKTVKVGGCECQPRAFMELTQRGDVIAGIPVPVETAKPYGVWPAGSGATYGASSAETTVYAPNSGSPDLYR